MVNNPLLLAVVRERPRARRRTLARLDGRPGFRPDPRPWGVARAPSVDRRGAGEAKRGALLNDDGRSEVPRELCKEPYETDGRGSGDLRSKEDAGPKRRLADDRQIPPGP